MNQNPGNSCITLNETLASLRFPVSSFSPIERIVIIEMFFIGLRKCIENTLQGAKQNQIKTKYSIGIISELGPQGLQLL